MSATPGAELSDAARRVQDAIAARGYDYRVIELAIPVRTAADAAREVKCEVGQIAKSIIFKSASGRGVLVITSGSNRVDEAKVAALVGESIGRAEPGWVREITGYAIGGIPPLGHASPMTTFVDEDLLRFAEIWAAAGHPNSLFRLDPKDLPGLSGGTLAKVAV